MKHQIKFFLALLIATILGSCTTVKMSEGTLQKVVAGRPNQPTEYEVEFVLDLPKTTQISNNLIPERTPEIPFAIKGIFDQNNKMYSVKRELPKGKYRVVASSEDKKFTPSDSAIFLLTIDKKTLKVATILKENKNKK